MGKQFAATLLFTLAVAFGSVAQSPSNSEASARTPEPSPFAAIHAELDRAADTTLATLSQTPAIAPIESDHDEKPASPAEAETFDEPFRHGARQSGAATLRRLDVLRPIVEPILRSEGIPTELASVIVVESGGKVNALSPKGALGLWQLMPHTARRYGLEVTAVTDERVNVEKSTRAAARYLRDLYRQFGSWPLALAGYNAGEGALQRAIARGRSLDFFQLSHLKLVPPETRIYVPAVLASMRYLGNHNLFTSTNTGTLLFATSTALCSNLRPDRAPN
jgi:membrane-bound lytic murein transglycosylase D